MAAIAFGLVPNAVVVLISGALALAVLVALIAGIGCAWFGSRA